MIGSSRDYTVTTRFDLKSELFLYLKKWNFKEEFEHETTEKELITAKLTIVS